MKDLPEARGGEAPFDLVALYGGPEAGDRVGQLGRRYHLHNETGVGEIVVYPVLPGVRVVYNDLHLAYCNKGRVREPGVIEINHCREGRRECRVGRQRCCYVAPGDFAIVGLGHPMEGSCFPTGHYHGISIYLEPAAMTGQLRGVMDLLSIDLEHIQSLVCQEDRLFIMRANPSIEHIFSELYSIRETRKGGYLTVKVLELLLFLSDLDGTEAVEDRVYLNRTHVEKAKAVHDRIVGDLRQHHTIAGLAQQVGLSPTALKGIFRSVYGVPVYTYWKTYRLQEAQKLLLRTDQPVAQIAAAVGYENPNKFTAAFQKAYGLSPTAFRAAVGKRMEEN